MPDSACERLVVCRNPLLADERARKRRKLLDATEQKLRDLLSRPKLAGLTAKNRRIQGD